MAKTLVFHTKKGSSILPGGTQERGSSPARGARTETEPESHPEGFGLSLDARREGWYTFLMDHYLVRAVYDKWEDPWGSLVDVKRVVETRLVSGTGEYIELSISGDPMGSKDSVEIYKDRNGISYVQQPTVDYWGGSFRTFANAARESVYFEVLRPTSRTRYIIDGSPVTAKMLVCRAIALGDYGDGAQFT